MRRDPVAVSKAYTPDSIWRNRDCFLQGTDAIIAFLTSKWEKEQGYRLRKELFAWTGNKIAVQVGVLLSLPYLQFGFSEGGMAKGERRLRR